MRPAERLVGGEDGLLLVLRKAGPRLVRLRGRRRALVKGAIAVVLAQEAVQSLLAIGKFYGAQNAVFISDNEEWGDGRGPSFKLQVHGMFLS